MQNTNQPVFNTPGPDNSQQRAINFALLRFIMAHPSCKRMKTALQGSYTPWGKWLLASDKKLEDYFLSLAICDHNPNFIEKLRTVKLTATQKQIEASLAQQTAQSQNACAAEAPEQKEIRSEFDHLSLHVKINLVLCALAATHLYPHTKKSLKKEEPTIDAIFSKSELLKQYFCRLSKSLGERAFRATLHKLKDNAIHMSFLKDTLDPKHMDTPDNLHKETDILHTCIRQGLMNRVNKNIQLLALIGNHFYPELQQILKKFSISNLFSQDNLLIDYLIRHRIGLKYAKFIQKSIELQVRLASKPHLAVVTQKQKDVRNATYNQEVGPRQIRKNLELLETIATEAYGEKLETVNASWEKYVFSNDPSLAHYFLRHAVTTGNVKFVKTLIKFGVDVNISDADGVSLLQVVAQKQQLDIFDALIVGGAETQYVTDAGYVAQIQRNLEFLATITYSHPKMQEALKEPNQHWGELVSSNDKSLECYLLVRAVQVGDILFIGNLDKSEVNLNITNEHGMSLLQIAAQRQDISMLLTLAEQGADPQYLTYYGCIPQINRNIEFLTLIGRFYPKIQNELEESADDWGELVLFDSPLLENYLLKYGVNSGVVNFVKEIIGFGINTALTNEKSISLFQIAVQQQNFEMLMVLLDGFTLQGVDIQSRNSKGYNILGVVLDNMFTNPQEDCLHKSLEIIRFLLTKGIQLPAVQISNLIIAHTNFANYGNDDLLKYYHQAAFLNKKAEEIFSSMQTEAADIPLPALSIREDDCTDAFAPGLRV